MNSNAQAAKSPQSLQNLCVEPPSYCINIVMDCARGLAALWVFLFHISDIVYKSAPAFYALAKEGHRGVPIFFVISGYCIFSAAQTTIASNGSSSTFLKRRIMRIFPAFLLSIIVILIFPFFLEALSSLKTGHYLQPTPRWLNYSVFDWLTVLTLTKDLSDGVFGTSEGYTLINSVYWTLSVELQFYLIVFISISLRKNWIKFLFLVSILSFLAAYVEILQIPGSFLQFWPAFCLGILLRVAHLRNITPSAIFKENELLVSLFSLVMILGIIASLDTKQGTHQTLFLVSASFAFLTLWWLGGVEHAITKNSLTWPKVLKIDKIILLPLAILGECSYSLYLLHGKIYQFPEMFIRQIIEIENSLYLLFTLIGTTVLCYGFYMICERPFQASAAKSQLTRFPSNAAAAN